MFNETTRKIEELLKLKRQVAALRFITYKKEYDDLEINEFKGKNRLCGFVSLGGKNKHFKVKKDYFSCSNGPKQVGMTKSKEIESSGRLLANCGLYSDFSIAREVTDSLNKIPQEIYGLEIGPITQMGKVDLVVIIGMTEQIMQVIHGYTYFYGVPSNTISVGNAAMCSDLVSKPFMKNDINLSFMCCGARTSTVSDFGELAVGMPINIYRNVSNSILKILENEEEI